MLLPKMTNWKLIRDCGLSGALHQLQAFQITHERVNSLNIKDMQLVNILSVSVGLTSSRVFIKCCYALKHYAMIKSHTNEINKHAERKSNY